MTTVIHSETLAPRAPWSYTLLAGQELRIVDLDGNQAVDFLAYDAHDTSRAYSAQATLQGQDSVFLTTGSVLRDNEYAPLLTVIADQVGRHDTLGGACSKESNTLRYGHHTWSQHACAENFVRELSKYGLGKRDHVANVNWFMNVPVDPDGALGIVDGISAPGLGLRLRAEKDTLVLISNCPQVNNPCNGFNPSRVELVIENGTPVVDDGAVVAENGAPVAEDGALVVKGSALVVNGSGLVADDGSSSAAVGA